MLIDVQGWITFNTTIFVKTLNTNMEHGFNVKIYILYYPFKAER
jgi:hypothetical protein